jgi:hypothetical protein
MKTPTPEALAEARRRIAAAEHWTPLLGYNPHTAVGEVLPADQNAYRPTIESSYDATLAEYEAVNEHGLDVLERMGEVYDACAGITDAELRRELDRREQGRVRAAYIAVRDELAATERAAAELRRTLEAIAFLRDYPSLVPATATP